MRQLHRPRMEPIATPSGPYHGLPTKLPACRHPHDILDGVTCTLDNGHRSNLHAATRNGEVLRW